MQRTKTILWGLLLLGVAAGTMAQAQGTVVQVVTKRLERNFAYKAGYELNIEGEKAFVDIRVWERPEISVKMELTAKHPDRAVAEADLAAMKYLMHRIKHRIYARNYIADEAVRAGVKSVLSAQYTIMVPKECPVYLKNHFGEATVADLTNRLKINGEFTKIGLENIQGILDVSTRFGDLTAHRLDGRVSLISRRSDIALHDIKGSYDIQAQYGLIEIFSADELINLNIVAERADVRFYDLNPAAFGYALTAHHGNIHLPSMLKAAYAQPAAHIKKVEFKPRAEFYPSISIRVTFGDIVVDRKR